MDDAAPWMMIPPLQPSFQPNPRLEVQKYKYWLSEHILDGGGCTLYTALYSSRLSAINETKK